MTLRCSFITSSYFNVSLRISAFLPSTVFWARSMALETILASIGKSSGIVRSMTHETAPVANSRSRSSCERQVEAALAGVALTSGTTAQLVVDASRVVALGAEHVESTERAHVVALRLAGSGLNVRQRASGRRRRTPRYRASKPRPMRLARRETLEVATEHDVHASSGHVGRDRDGVLCVPPGPRSRLRGSVAWRSGPRGGSRPWRVRARGVRTSRPRPCRAGSAGRGRCARARPRRSPRTSRLRSCRSGRAGRGG